MTREIKDAKNSDMKMWRMIDKLKGTDNELEVEKPRVHGEMMNYRSSIYKKENNEMMREWGDGDREKYCNLWHQMSEVGGTMTIRYNNTEIHERVPEHLMRDLDVRQGRMWKRRDGRFVVQYNREVVRQTFASNMEEHIDVLSGRMGNETRYPMRRVVFTEDEIRSALGAIKGGKATWTR